ncbi:m7GpppX diphosphatase-like [Sycon ciliatum]|uniref:m7GpppX diphosphatase-like n=1 Tax=Sycon ciliatum TaxID=27933 RepID=UPI0020AA2132|eukprot:scpid69157/ scgid19238/ m7GpppX diphosphatase; DCS-1; Hint-related 7meGMP-directed hydrolase; Histidine triad protein member 5; Scavenger mRNA-decapping enzyme DcpS
MALTNLVDFSITRVLNESADSKTIFLLGRFEGRSGEAIVLLEKLAITEAVCQQFIVDKSVKLEFTMQNDIYSLYNGHGDVTRMNEIKVTIIEPVTSRLIEKFSAQQIHMIRETAEDYRLVTQHYLKETAKDLQWVENILEKKAERDRVLCEDDDADIGFTLAADMKWDQKQAEELYVLAICRKRGLASLRDLDGRHVAMLCNIRDKSLACLKERYGLQASQVRAFLHYQPSCYHLHVHFTHVRLQQPGTVVGKAHLLDDVIDNITLIDEHYYQKCAVTYQLQATHPLLALLRKRHGECLDDTVTS